MPNSFAKSMPKLQLCESNWLNAEDLRMPDLRAPLAKSLHGLCRWSHHQRHSQNTSTFKAPDCASNTQFFPGALALLPLLTLKETTPLTTTTTLKVVGSIPRNTCHLWWIAVAVLVMVAMVLLLMLLLEAWLCSCLAGAAGSCWWDCAASGAGRANLAVSGAVSGAGFQSKERSSGWPGGLEYMLSEISAPWNQKSYNSRFVLQRPLICNLAGCWDVIARSKWAT